MTRLLPTLALAIVCTAPVFGQCRKICPQFEIGEVSTGGYLYMGTRHDNAGTTTCDPYEVVFVVLDDDEQFGMCFGACACVGCQGLGGGGRAPNKPVKPTPDPLSTKRDAKSPYLKLTAAPTRVVTLRAEQEPLPKVKLPVRSEDDPEDRNLKAYEWNPTKDGINRGNIDVDPATTEELISGFTVRIKIKTNTYQYERLSAFRHARGKENAGRREFTIGAGAECKPVEKLPIFHAKTHMLNYYKKCDGKYVLVNGHKDFVIVESAGMRFLVRVKDSTKWAQINPSLVKD